MLYYLVHSMYVVLKYNGKGEYACMSAQVSALEFLWAAEPRPRLTGETIGVISLQLEASNETQPTTSVPLVVGQNIDSMLQPYAPALVSRRVNVTWVNGADSLSLYLSLSLSLLLTVSL